MKPDSSTATRRRERQLTWEEADKHLDELDAMRMTLPIDTYRQRQIRGCVALVIGELLSRRDDAEETAKSP